MRNVLQRAILPDGCILVVEKTDEGNFDIAIVQVVENVAHHLDNCTYEPDAWKKAGLKLDELIAKLRKHDNWKDMGKAWVKWIDANRPMLPREM
jgi:hypothetical protein